MMLDFPCLWDKYIQGNISGVVEVGAHVLEELEIYKHYGINNRLWVEANPRLFAAAKMSNPDEKIVNAAVFDQDNLELDFHITNNLASSSLLELGTHLTLHPNIYETEIVKVKTKKLSTILNEQSFNPQDCLLNIDVQGAELQVLKGAENYLSLFKYVMCEVNLQEVYKGCGLLPEIDEYLKTFGFVRKESEIFANAWGDAFYIKEL